MNAKKALCLFILLFTILATCVQGANVFFEVKGAYFFPSDQFVREIYGKGTSWGGELAFRILSNWLVWAEADYFSKTGTLLGSEETTTIRIVPIVLGVRYELSAARVRPYLGLGMAFFQYKEKNILGTMTKGALGLAARAGVLAEIAPAFFVDAQGSWSACRVHPVPTEDPVNLGGFRAGLGLGFEF